MDLRSLLCLAVVVPLGLAGCTDPDRTDAEPTPRPSVSSAATNGSPEPSDTGGPAAATGPLVEVDSISYRLPEDGEWKLHNGDTGAVHRDDEGNRYVIAVNEIPDRSGGQNDLDHAAELSLSSTVLYDPPLERGQNRTINGIEGWTAETVDDAFGEIVYRFGTIHADHDVYLTFMGPGKIRQTREWIEAVLASIQWR